MPSVYSFDEESVRENYSAASMLDRPSRCSKYFDLALAVPLNHSRDPYPRETSIYKVREKHGGASLLVRPRISSTNRSIPAFPSSLSVVRAAQGSEKRTRTTIEALPQLTINSSFPPSEYSSSVQETTSVNLPRATPPGKLLGGVVDYRSHDNDRGTRKKGGSFSGEPHDKPRNGGVWQLRVFPA